MPSSGEQQPTLGEIGRSVNRLEQEIGNVRGDIQSLEDKVPTREVIESMKDAFQANLVSTELKWNEKFKAVEAQISDLQDWKQWTLRLIVGGVLMAVLGLVIATGLSNWSTLHKL